ncbi:MAG: hypothetical protein ACRD82_06285, partial [Blastocatellia bacterium]
MKRINRLTSLLLVVCLSVAPVFGTEREAVATRYFSLFGTEREAVATRYFPDGVDLQTTRSLPLPVPYQQPVAKPQTVAELQARIAALLDQPKFAAARWGVLVKV